MNKTAKKKDQGNLIAFSIGFVLITILILIYLL